MPGRVRQGIGRALMEPGDGAGDEAGVRRLDCLSTRTAVPFYAALGFRALGTVEVPLRPGIVFPAVRMACDLAPSAFDLAHGARRRGWCCWPDIGGGTMAGQIERHFIDRIGWLRAAVLGANDGIVSTASLIVGVAAAATGRAEILVAGAAGLAAGALSMAAGEYVSVSSQADSEEADLARERAELATCPRRNWRNLTGIYVARGVSAETARKVARRTDGP